ncbi:feS cluster assembly sufB domain protein [Escherichia coli 6-175-07_S3_C1]|nr:feS cluster assembly sufB domain protein [Escherichia coli 6-175-07_S3_C2]KEL96209.1 feS cluster assembly sufB domain protein [Escherichia coli 6-175-07_S3_C1]KEM03519.1 feS cluster assembly sufB domain protein [Escherichia coli 6-175-07_S3_C3]KEM22240.1 feS cluster assembly sufB domain protein [Escherichia coli 6-319-05_S3_C1]KEM31458.1 feS cluster assembly sufB domain protein [Escherichia coli 6-319-05_S3_C2]KEM63508.1 feS cluster assembly sufB domain protein [Escherichia coli 6-319-05_S3
MSRNTEATDDVKTWTGGPLNYKEGFFTQLATDELAKGINEEVVRAISAKRNEPEWMLEFRLNAYHAWLEMEEPHWLKAHYDKLNYQDYSYYSAPSCGNCDDNCASEPGAVQQTGANAFLSKEVEAAFEQLGVPVREGKRGGSGCHFRLCFGCHYLSRKTGGAGNYFLFLWRGDPRSPGTGA